jgi:hypothetical protein
MIQYKTILHVQVGSQYWEPTDRDLKAVEAQFKAALKSSDGAAVVTRNDVHVTFVEIPSDLTEVHVTTYNNEEAGEQ